MENKTRTVIIVGGSSGIGFELATRLSSRGWTVINISRTPCKIEGVKNATADVTTPTFGDALERCAKKYGLDALVYCAGFSMAAPVEYAKESDYRYLFDVNYFGALKAMQCAIPYLKGKGGRIVLVGSLGGDIPIVFDSFYSSSKAALEMLARSAYSELKPCNIKITAYLPGGTATGFTFKRKVYGEEETKSYAQSVNKAVAALADMEQSGMHPAVVAEDIYDVLISDKPPVIKTAGFKNRAFRLFSRMMPEKFTLYVNDKAYKQ